MKYSPIVLFLYNRPQHTKLTLNALADNVEAIESELFIYCDGLKPGSSDKDKDNVLAVRQIANEENRFKKVNVIYREQNLGLANSIISGVTEIVNRFGRIIVLEDDIVPSIGFLKYMNEALNLYENEDNVGCIHAWNFNLITDSLDSTFFLPGADCWGWATWKKSWNLFEKDGKNLLKKIVDDHLEFSFDRNGLYPFVQMLKDQIEMKNDSWAIRWHASLFLQNKFCLHPTRTIVKNIGFDNTGVHCGSDDIIQVPIDFIDLKKINIEESNWFYNSYFEYIKKNEVKLNFYQKLKKKMFIMMPSLMNILKRLVNKYFK